MSHEAFKVKLCPQCPYTPADLEKECGESLYDPSAEDYCCGQCPEAPMYRPPGVTFPKPVYLAKWR